MSSKAIPEPWHSFLKELDGALSQELHFHCMGGFVVTFFYGFSRNTSDLDVLSIATTDGRFFSLIELGREGSELHRKYGVCLHCVTVAQVPDSYDERLTEMFSGTFEHLRLFALDPYDLALSKLERNEQIDRDDVRHLARTVPFDLVVLQDRYHKEMRHCLGVPEREDLTLKLWVEAIEEERTKKNV